MKANFLDKKYTSIPDENYVEMKKKRRPCNKS
jgi:hypothetical protein